MTVYSNPGGILHLDGMPFPVRMPVEIPPGLPCVWWVGEFSKSADPAGHVEGDLVVTCSWAQIKPERVFVEIFTRTSHPPFAQEPGGLDYHYPFYPALPLASPGRFPWQW